MELFIFTGILALVTGFISGLLGIGGGIILAPLLLFLPPMFGMHELTMHTVAGLTVVQGLAACVSGALAHRRFNFVSGQLMVWMGTVIFGTAFAGGAAAVYLENSILLVIFSLLAFTAALLMLVPTAGDSEAPDIRNFSFSRLRAVTASGTVGLVGGMVGQGGSFILIPLMTSYMQVPTRIAIGSNLAIVLLSSLAAFLGKAVTGQIDWFLALPVLLCAPPATHVGSFLSRRVPVVYLRRLLAACIALAAIRLAVAASGG
jgi:hypothetical protein